MESKNMDNSGRAVLLRPAYPYGRPQVWMPSDLYRVASKLDGAGISTDVIDLNLQNIPSNLNSYDHVGIGVIGPPYIPGTIVLAKTVKEMTGKEALIGGPGVEHLSGMQFRKLYGSAVQIKDDKTLSGAIGRDIPNQYSVSIAGQVDRLSLDLRRKYLESEFSLFVSQGCKFACEFCAATRSRPGNAVRERYSEKISEDLECLTANAKSLGINKLTMYLTPLDLFQSPSALKNTFKTISRIRKSSGLEFVLRGLSRVDSFLSALDDEPELEGLIPEAGLKIVGFGVDGTSEEVWRSQHKGNRSLSYVEDAFSRCNSLGITPEALMVMGFHNANGLPADTEDSLRSNVKYSLEWADKFGAVARPHVAKDLVPGNSGWDNLIWHSQRSKLLDDPRLFKNLDFVALASDLTHPNADFRRQVNRAYLDIIKKLTPNGLCATTPLLPLGLSSIDEEVAEVFNMLVPPDR